MLDKMTNLQTRLKDPSLLATQGYLAGDWQDGTDGTTFEVLNPARGDVIAHVADFDRAQTAEAISKAEIAQKQWAARTGKERANILRCWYDLMMENADDLAIILTAEQGKPLAEGIGEIYRAGQFFTYYAAEVLRQIGDNADSVRPGIEIDVRRDPVGIVAVISPWNFPTATAVWKIAPALALLSLVLGLNLLADGLREESLRD